MSFLKVRLLALLRKFQFEISAALGLGLMIGIFTGFYSFDTWFYEFQLGLLICLSLGVAHQFWPRINLYWDLLLTNPIIGLAIPLLVAISYGYLFSDLGFYYLFWSNPPWNPLVSSLSLVFTIAVHWLLLYFLYIDSYDSSLEPAAGIGEGGGLDRFQQSQRHAKRLWFEFGLEGESADRQAGRFVYESTKPLAMILAIPALLPRFAIVKSSSGLFQIDPTSVSWLAGIILGMLLVHLSLSWIGSAARLDWSLRDRRNPERQAGVSNLLDLTKIFAILIPVLAGLYIAYHVSRWPAGFSMGLTIVMIVVLFFRAYWLRRTEPSVSRLNEALYNDYLFVLLGIICFFLSVSLLLHLNNGFFASTVCICYIMIVGSCIVALLDWLFTSQSFHRQMTSVVFILILLLVNGINPYKLQFDGLAGYYPEGLTGTSSGTKRPTKLAAYQAEEAMRFTNPSTAVEPPLLDDGAILAKWGAFQKELHPDSSMKPKLVVVACSGGALRAAIWTALILGKIEKDVPDFPQSLRIITGASGGMLGAAHYVTSLQKVRDVGGVPVLRLPVVGEEFAKELRADFLTKPVQYLVFSEAVAVPTPFFKPLDRGKILEQVWRDKLKGLSSAMTFRKLAEDEKLGARPSLVFTPMIVEDSRRLFISNLDLRQFTVTHGRFDPITRLKTYNPPETPKNGAPPPDDNDNDNSKPDTDAVFPYYSRVGYQFFRLFPLAHKSFPVSSAVRMSATFPLISPTVNLPTEPPLRVVDAGYYDNYGVDMATAWLEEHREWLLRNTSGVALIQIRAFTNEENLRNYPKLKRGGTTSDMILSKLGEWFDRGSQFLTSPLTGVANARQLVMSYRNDVKVEDLKKRFTFDKFDELNDFHLIDGNSWNGDPGKKAILMARYKEARDFFRIFTFTCGVVQADDRKKVNPAGQDIPDFETMNWFVTESDFSLFTGPIWNNNNTRFKGLVDWLKSNSQNKSGPST